MRIGMMADLYKPHISGVTNYISLNKQFLEQLGHQVFVFTFGHGEYQDEESNIIRSPGAPVFVKNLNLNLRYTKRARKLLQTMDVVHVNHPFISGSLSLLYCRPIGIPIIFTNHTRYDLYAKAYVPLVGGAVKLLAMQLFIPTFTSLVDLVVSPSAGMRQVLIEAGVKAPIDVVPNGVDLQPFREPKHVRCRTEFGFTEQDVLFFFVGRLGSEKNLAFLLKSFYEAYQRNPHCALFLVGEGPLREELRTWVEERGISPRVIFTGLIPYEEMPGYMTMADVFATASISEVHPLTVIEAMAAGLPVIGIQSPGVGDTVVDGITGLLCPQLEQTQFSQAMIDLVVDRERRLELGTQARRASEQYAIERSVQEMLKRYERVIDEHAGQRRRRIKPERGIVRR